MIRGIKFVSIPVRDQDVSLKFYTEALGMKVTTDQAFTPTQRWIELMIPGADAGISLFTPDGHEKRIGEFQSISSAAVFRDPDGNQFVLSSRGKQR
jgi:catechol 2,3-dioxygenase-like lactoylglutathione lyase family enzyme